MKVAVLGLGAMGSRMVRNLVKAGHDVFMWNRSPAAVAALADCGARACRLPRDAAERADVVIACVRDDEASRAVWMDPDYGALSGLRPGTVAIESSTLTVAWTQTLAGLMAERGIDFLDAPVLGSRPQAETGMLIHVVGGQANVLDRALPVLSALGSAAYLMGSAGSGAAMKLMINALMGIQTAALAELLPSAARQGIKLEQIVQVLGQTPVCSPFMRAASDSMMRQAFSPLFPIELVEKDLSYLVSEAGKGMTPVAERARDVFRSAMNLGMGDLNQTAVARLYGDAQDEG